MMCVYGITHFNILRKESLFLPPPEGGGFPPMANERI